MGKKIKIGTIVASYPRMFIVAITNSLTNVFIPFSPSSSLSNINGFHNHCCISCMLLYISSLSRSLPFFVCCSDIHSWYYYHYGCFCFDFNPMSLISVDWYNWSRKVKRIDRPDKLQLLLPWCSSAAVSCFQDRWIKIL